MDITGLIRELERKRVKLGSWKAVASALGVTQQYVHDVKKQRRLPGTSMLNALGLKRTVAYVKIAQPETEVTNA